MKASILVALSLGFLAAALPQFQHDSLPEPDGILGLAPRQTPDTTAFGSNGLPSNTIPRLGPPGQQPQDDYGSVEELLLEPLLDPLLEALGGPPLGSRAAQADSVGSNGD